MDPCKDRLSDIEYLEHMIPHHQVAIDMSKALLRSTRNPRLAHMARDISWTQTNEITHMRMLLDGIPDVASNRQKFNRHLPVTDLAYYAPKDVEDHNASCGKHFFNTAHAHAAHNVTGAEYLKHMIPHHQVAIDMSRRLLLHTSSPVMMALAQRIIYEQQAEIYTMKHLLTGLGKFQALLI